MAASIGMLAAIAQPHCRARGTGLGLAMARGFAEQSGGALAIRTMMNVGTTATLWLPVGAASPRRENGPIPPSEADGARLLLVRKPVGREKLAALMA